VWFLLRIQLKEVLFLGTFASTKYVYIYFLLICFIDTSVGVYVKSRHFKSTKKVAIEIVAPCLTLIIEKFRPNENGKYTFNWMELLTEYYFVFLQNIYIFTKICCLNNVLSKIVFLMLFGARIILIIFNTIILTFQACVATSLSTAFDPNKKYSYRKI